VGRIAEPENLEVVLLHPTESLLCQVGQWSEKDPRVCLRVVRATAAGSVRTALDSRSVALIDATDQLRSALGAVEAAVALGRASSSAVYTETMHDGLELFARMRAVMVLLGPMDGPAWDGLFTGMFRCLRRSAGPQPTMIPAHPRVRRE
jgi:hypothetical protein